MGRDGVTMSSLRMRRASMSSAFSKWQASSRICLWPTCTRVILATCSAGRSEQLNVSTVCDTRPWWLLAASLRPVACVAALRGRCRLHVSLSRKGANIHPRPTRAQMMGGMARRSLTLEEGKGTAFYQFDEIPSTKEFIEQWYRQLNELDLTEAQKEAIVDEGNLVFTLNIEIFEELDGSPIKALWALASSSLKSALGLGK